MRSQEPRDEPPPRPPKGPAGPPGPDAQGDPRPPVGPPVDPYAPSPEGRPDSGSEQPPGQSPEQPPGQQPEKYEGVPYHPDPFEQPYLGESPTLRGARTPQMQRNAEYHEAQRREAPPYRPDEIGRFKWEAPVQTMPTDVIWPMISRKKRSRRSDWPVLVFALVVAAIVTIGCCLAGFAGFSAWNPFGD
jgi:hypothetical protein